VDAVLAAALGADEPEVWVRLDGAYGRRLTRLGDQEVVLPTGSDWRLEMGEPGDLSSLKVIDAPETPLLEGQVRVGLRAAGVNFHDVVAGLGMVDDGRVMGAEGAGIVLETGPGVSGLAVGQPVLGLIPGWGPSRVVDHRVLTAVPEGWSFEQAAAISTVFLTAFYGLRDLGEVDKAVDAYQQALRLRPDLADVHNNLAAEAFLYADAMMKLTKTLTDPVEFDPDQLAKDEEESRKKKDGGGAA